MNKILLFKRLAAALSVSLICSGCPVGPNYHPPEAPSTTTYTATPFPDKTASVPGPGGAEQHLALGQEIPAEWWKLFHSAPLDQLVRQALSGNPTLAAAQATLRESQETLNALVGSVLYPKVDASASVTREKISGAEFGLPNEQFPPFTLYNASVNVSYALDLFGGARRELEALESQVDFQRFQLEGAYLTITSNVVTTAVKEASLRAQIQALHEIIAALQTQLDLVELQFKLGGAARPDVLAQRTQLAQTKATLPSLEKELEQTRHLLAVFAGRFPSDSALLPAFNLDQLQLPAELPVSLPSSLVRQRPDIRASEALLHAASAQVGVATANQYPQINLTGSLGSMAISSNTLFSTGTGVWSLGAGLLQPVFHGGQLSAERRAAVAAYDQAVAQYQVVVLQAFQNVADVLRALDADAETLKEQADADQSARNTLELTQKQFQLGGVSYLSLLNAERQYQQTRIGLIQAQAARYADTAALFQALGGGWWNRNGHSGPVSDFENGRNSSLSMP
ncbi:MAG TPA: efflux transporter outer membrane subunit [Nitrospirota bacterium]|nr:efflux transporter outer membrane subunit [Nitrospirota bacterium]